MVLSFEKSIAFLPCLLLLLALFNFAAPEDSDDSSAAIREALDDFTACVFSKVSGDEILGTLMGETIMSIFGDECPGSELTPSKPKYCTCDVNKQECLKGCGDCHQVPNGGLNCTFVRPGEEIPNTEEHCTWLEYPNKLDSDCKLRWIGKPPGYCGVRDIKMIAGATSSPSEKHFSKRSKRSPRLGSGLREEAIDIKYCGNCTIVGIDSSCNYTMNNVNEPGFEYHCQQDSSGDNRNMKSQTTCDRVRVPSFGEKFMNATMECMSQVDTLKCCIEKSVNPECYVLCGAPGDIKQLSKKTLTTCNLFFNKIMKCYVERKIGKKFDPNGELCTQACEVCDAVKACSLVQFLPGSLGDFALALCMAEGQMNCQIKKMQGGGVLECWQMILKKVWSKVKGSRETLIKCNLYNGYG